MAGYVLANDIDLIWPLTWFQGHGLPVGLLFCGTVRGMVNISKQSMTLTGKYNFRWPGFTVGSTCPNTEIA